MWYESPIFLTPLTLLGGAIVAYVVSWFVKRKQQVENSQKEQAQQSELTLLKLRHEIDEQKRTYAEETRLAAIRTAQQEAQLLTLNAIAALAEKQNAIGLVVEKTHIEVNSNKTTADKIEMELRSELKAVILAAATAAQAAAIAAQTLKDQAVQVMEMHKNEIAELLRQNAALTRYVVPHVGEFVPVIEAAPAVLVVAESPKS